MATDFKFPAYPDDTIYEVKAYGKNKGVSKWVVSRIVVTRGNIWYHVHGNGTAQIIPIEWIGKTIFTDELKAYEYFKSQTTQKE